MNWILIGYVINVVINYILIRRIVRSEKDCPGCTYELCDRHYGWGDVFKSFLLSLGGYITLVWLIFGALGRLVEIILNTNKKPPKWL